MRSKLVLAAAAAIVVAALASFVRFQPPGQTTFFRADRSLVVRGTPVYLRPLTTAGQCRVAGINGHFAFDGNAIGVTATGDEFPLHVRFSYSPPASLPSDWPAGDWCASLATSVAAIAR